MNTNRLPLPRRSTKEFTWCSRSRRFVAEISELHNAVLASRVFNDACDEGFTLVSERTGEEMTMILESESRDNEGELLYWTFKPERETALFTVRVFND